MALDADHETEPSRGLSHRGHGQLHTGTAPVRSVPRPPGWVHPDLVPSGAMLEPAHAPSPPFLQRVAKITGRQRDRLRRHYADLHTAFELATQPDGSSSMLARWMTGWRYARDNNIQPALQKCKRGWIAFNRLQPMRFMSGSLARRIFFANVLGLTTLVAGVLVLSRHNAWLIDAKRESLIAQGEIIAAGISSNATMDKGRMVLDPDRLPEIEGARIPFRTDGYAANELTIRPEVVMPVLRRLMSFSSTVRARVYTTEGKLVVDSAHMLQRGQIARSEPDAAAQPRAKTNWTRVFERFSKFGGTNLPVYQEIGTAYGTTYPEVRMALSSGATTPMLLLTQDGEQIVSIAAPIRRAGVIQGVLLLSSKPGEIDKILDDERKALFAIGGLALLASMLASLLLARTVARPMRQLSEAAEHVSHNITARRELPEFPGRQDEVGQMATAFKAMTKSLYRRIEASEKFAADVAHELKNPLTAARSTAESLTYAKTNEQRDQLVKQIQGEIQRLSGLITDVSNASRLDAELARQQTVPVDLSQVADTLVTTFRDILSEGQKNIELELAPTLAANPFTVDGHEGRLAQVATNLIDNALSFSPPTGLVTVRLQRLPGDIVELAVEDEGPGIEEDKLETVFTRFYTYRPTAQSSRGRNSGLGLSISREIVLAHAGQVWAENRYGDDDPEHTKRLGARFVMQIPATRPVVVNRSLTGRVRRH
jgi:two-component system, OmpR family, sensor histidine kinase ChvG